MNETRQLASFIAGLEYDELPPPVIAKAKGFVLDIIGVMLACSTLPWSKIVYDYVRSWGACTPESTIIATGYQTKAENAVFANSTFAHGFEVDDHYPAGQSHPGCIVVPCALAMGERQSISGKDLILAVVAGYEAMGRINKAIAPSSLLKGFHAPTSISGPFGAAAAAGKLLKLDAGLMVNALSIAGSHASGVTEYSHGGGSVKRMHAGMAAHGGVRAALIAQAGITAPATILEGQHGFCQAFADEFRLSEITEDLGTDYRVVMGTGAKLYCACGGIHPAIDAMSALITKHHITPQAVDNVIIGVNRQSVSHLAAPITDITGAQFNAAFSLALTLLRGSNGFSDYTEETIRDEAILTLSKRISLELDSEVDADFPEKRSARVTVRLKSGECYQEKVDYCKGLPQNPVTVEEFEAKFRDFAGVVLGAEQIGEIIERVHDLDKQKNLSALIALIGSAPNRSAAQEMARS